MDSIAAVSGSAGLAQIRQLMPGLDDMGDWGGVRASSVAMRSENPIRRVVDSVMNAKRDNLEKEMISLAIGDPTVFTSPPPEMSAAIAQVLDSGRGNSYTHSAGSRECREAIAGAMAKPKVSADDVVVTVGCSQALQMCLTVLADPNRGANVLLPCPTFPLYTTICQHIGVEARLYRLQADNNWEVDLDHVESLADANTACILICNPSNPTGAVFSESHLKAIVATAARLHIPIVADEVYADMVFKGERFLSVAEVSENVPCLVVGALSKRFLVPGWRLGWIIAHDRQGILRAGNIYDALSRLTQITIGTSTLVQAAVPQIIQALLEQAPEPSRENGGGGGGGGGGTSEIQDQPPLPRLDYLQTFMAQCQASLAVAIERINAIPCLHCPAQPKGAMYLMIALRLDLLRGIASDEEFCQRLYGEQAVLCIPGTAFQYPGYIRVVLCLSEARLAQALDRVAEMCAKYARREDEAQE